MAAICISVCAQEKQIEPKNEEVKTESLSTNLTYFIDGIKVDQPQGISPKSNININSLVNPMDIASMDVLKGEMAVKAYGNDGQNGIVFITTRKGPQQPICIVDGEIKSGGFGILANLNPDDVQSVQVLKGESALTTYGSPGKNGVIVVTTKKYAEGKSGHRK